MNDDIERAKSVLGVAARVLEEVRKVGGLALPITITFSEEKPTPSGTEKALLVTLSGAKSNTLTVKMPIQEEKEKGWFWRLLDRLNERLPLLFGFIFAAFLSFLAVVIYVSRAS